MKVHVKLAVTPHVVVGVPVVKVDVLVAARPDVKVDVMRHVVLGAAITVDLLVMVALDVMAAHHVGPVVKVDAKDVKDAEVLVKAHVVMYVLDVTQGVGIIAKVHVGRLVKITA